MKDRETIAKAEAEMGVGVGVDVCVPEVTAERAGDAIDYR